MHIQKIFLLGILFSYVIKPLINKSVLPDIALFKLSKITVL